MKTIFEFDPWRLIETELHKDDMRLSESMTSIGNGHMGMRGNFEERYSGDSHRGTYLAGVWFPDKTRVGWWKNGYPQYFGKVINAMNIISLRVRIDREDVDLYEDDVVSFSRVLDMRAGVLTREFVIRREKGRLNNLTIGLCGDLKFGRTVHSLIKSLVRWEGIRFVFISPEELHVPSYIIDEVVKPSGCEYKEVRTMDEVLPELDVLYMTRVQRERFFNEEDYIRLKDSFILDAEKMKLAPKDLIVLHPLPRINEIAVEVDDDPRAKYFVQAQNSVYVRMALILMLLNIEPGLFEEETVC